MNHTVYYDRDLAYVHDQGYSDLAKSAAKTIARLMKRPGTLVDLGCGSGVLEKELSDTSLELIGVDYAPEMIRIAKQNAPNAKFVIQSLFEFEIPTCDVVCSTGECFNYLFVGNGDLRSLFARIYQALRPQSYLIFDILTTELPPSSTNARIIENDRWTMFLSFDLSGDILARSITLFLKDEEGYRKSKELHQQKLFKVSDVEEILTVIGFRFEQIDSYEGNTFRPGQVGFICKK